MKAEKDNSVNTIETLDDIPNSEALLSAARFGTARYHTLSRRISRKERILRDSSPKTNIRFDPNVPLLPAPTLKSEAEQMDISKYIERLDQGRSESEERIHDSLNTLRTDLREDIKEFKGEMQAIRTEIKDEMREMRAELKDEIKETRNEVRDIGKWVKGICITTLLGIAAMVIAVVVVAG